MTIMKDLKQGESWKYEMKPLFDWVCKCIHLVKSGFISLNLVISMVSSLYTSGYIFF